MHCATIGVLVALNISPSDLRFNLACATSIGITRYCHFSEEIQWWGMTPEGSRTVVEDVGRRIVMGIIEEPGRGNGEYCARLHGSLVGGQKDQKGH